MEINTSYILRTVIEIRLDLFIQAYIMLQESLAETKIPSEISKPKYRFEPETKRK